MTSLQVTSRFDNTLKASDNLSQIQMSRFNVQTHPNKTVNFAGGEAYVQDPKVEFVSILLTNFVKDSFYRSADDSIARVAELINSVSDKKFLAKTAIYARTKFGMRSISHVVAGEIANSVKGQEWTKNFFDKVIFRPDDMMEIMAYTKAKFGKVEYHAVRKGFAKAFARFDEYQLSKYNQDKEISLIDIANIVHPDHSEAIEKLIKGTLKPANTWETKLAEAGRASTEEDKDFLKADVWKTLIKTKKIGYFALLRNLRNILEQAPEILPQALELLVNEQLIKKSLVLPFRFITAQKEIEQLNADGVRLILPAISQAVDISLSNVPKFDGKTLVVLDTSGSMSGQPLTIGALFAAILYKSNNADLMLFSNDAHYLTLNPTDSTATLQNLIISRSISGGTNFHAIFSEANRAYERMIILSDMQGWIGYDAPTADLAEYRRRTGANPFVYSFDLQGLGSMQFPEQNVFALSGFSEKIFDIMKLLEEDKQALIHEIEGVKL